MDFYEDASDAIRIANALATYATSPFAIGYVKPDGWIVYDPRNGGPEGAQPEFICFALGRLPLPLSDTAADVLRSAIRATLKED